MGSCQEGDYVQIAIHAANGASMFHLSVPQMVFDEVARQGIASWETILFAEVAGTITTAEGYQLGGIAGTEAARGADMVIVPAWHSDGRPLPDTLSSLLREAHGNGAIIAGLCLGAIPVVESGLLQGRKAVTHWQAFTLLADRHPGLELDETVLYVDHGDVLTAAGTASGLDACLHLVRTHLGAEAANRVARSLVIAPHREGGQAQYIKRPLPEDGTKDQLSLALRFAVEHIGEPLPISRWAAAAQMSPRSFARAFPAATGTTPARWLRAQRLDEARRLLEVTDYSVDRVAEECGLGSAVTLRQAFAATFGTSPTTYRRQFAAPLPVRARK